jgi:hypothetical protein
VPKSRLCALTLTAGRGPALMVTERLACALALPTRDAVCPVYTSPPVEVPALEVSVTVAVKLPEAAYTWLVVGAVVVTGALPSPKSHR